MKFYCQKCGKYSGNVVADLAFTGDLVLLNNEIKQAQELLQRLK